MEEAMNFHSSNMNHRCLVCGTDSLANYVDLTLVTSRTSQSETLVKEKLKTILRDKWITPDTEMSMVLCLPCFHLVDQFDVLENQIQNIRDNLTNKYVNTNGINKQKFPKPEPAPPSSNEESSDEDDDDDDDRSASPEVYTTPGRGRKLATIKITKRASNFIKREKTTPKRKKLSPEDKKSAAEAKKAAKNAAAEMKKAAALAKKAAAEAKKAALEAKREKARAERAKKTWRQGKPDGDPGTSRQLGEDGNMNQTGTTENGNQIRKDGGPEKTSEEEERERRMIYDDDPSVFNPGEKLRIGIIQASPDGSIAYECCYCIERYPDIETLKVHVRLGFGSKVNCGAQLNNVTASTDLSKPFVCIYCTGAFKFKSNINLHYKEKHTPYKPFACMDCHETFRRSMELSRHRVYYCPLSKKI
ncbi:hypothetical protein L9F63_018178 [Diploptera punctata]|uniref:C2H2-type domain-containing protein n=1 Tax=Diploptera punctata TaxID=6984 RepID=A0AAD8EFC3_DIPPU|nr:hypothetical protein L9F63_018178 [Diploptera punctata]